MKFKHGQKGRHPITMNWAPTFPCLAFSFIRSQCSNIKKEVIISTCTLSDGGRALASVQRDLREYTIGNCVWSCEYSLKNRNENG